MPANGGSNEYQNIIGSLSETSDKIDSVSTTLETEFSKKVPQEEVESASLLEGNHLATAGVALGTVAAPALFQPSLIDELAALVANLGSNISNFRLAAPAIGRGGLGGITSYLSKAAPMLGRIAGIVGIVATLVIEGSLFLYKTIDDKFIELNTKIMQLEADLSILTASYNRTITRVNSLERGVIQNERAIRELKREVETEMANLEQLIKQNHTQTLSKFQGLENSFEQNFEWQSNNGAAPTATLTKAAIERPNGMLEQTKTKIEKATEGDANDPEYSAAIAGGTAIAAGTIGAAAYKNRVAIQGSIEEAKTSLNNGMNQLKNQGKKLGSLINLGQIIQVVTLITTVHNALILSRDIGQTLFSVVDNGLNAALNALGIKNVDDEGVNTDKAFKEFLDSLGRSIFGVRTWTQIQASWAAANRITASANTLLWSVRDLADTTSSLAEMAAENSGKIGNLLRRSGVTQDIGRWFPENYSRETVFQQKMRDTLENVQNIAEAFENITSSVLSTQQTIQEIKENNDNFIKTLETEAPKIRVDNEPVRKAAADAAEVSYGPYITETDAKQSTGEEDATAS